MVTWQQWENNSFYIFSGLLIPIYCWLLYKTIKGSNLKFIKNVAGLLLLSNIGAITNALCYSKLRVMSTADNSSFAIRTMAILTALSIFFQNAGFALGEWIFSCQYFNISQTMPYVFERKQLPKEVAQRNRLINWIISGLCLLVPAMSALSYYIYKCAEKFFCPTTYKLGICSRYNFWDSLNVITRFMVAALLITSGLFLAYGVLKIRAIINGGKNTGIDVK